MPLKPEAALRKDKTNAKGEVLQHRHFAVIAGILAELDTSPEQRITICDHFALHLSATNPRFNSSRFLAACGVVGI